MRLSFITILLAILVVVGPTAVASHSTPDGSTQTWTLHDDNTMTRDTHAPSDVEGQVTIVGGDTSSPWCADEAAVADYDMRGLVYSAAVQLLQAHDLRISVGKCVPGETPVVCASTGIIDTESLGDLIGDTIHEFEHQRAVLLTRDLVPSATAGDECVVKVGEKLGMWIEAVNGQAKIGTHPIVRQPLFANVAGSTLTVEETPPAYPTPELGPFAFTAVGLIAIAGMALTRRKLD